MAKTLEDIDKVRKIAERLSKLGVSARITDKIYRWANEEVKRLRDEARK